MGSRRRRRLRGLSRESIRRRRLPHQMSGKNGKVHDLVSLIGGILSR
jgi:hypothetical protein